MRWRAAGPMVVTLLVGMSAARAEPPGQPAPAGTATHRRAGGADEPGAPADHGDHPPATRPGSTSRGTEYRFDVLRIDGEQRGPAVLEVRALAGARRLSLLRLRRSFVRRIFETTEAPWLHRR